MFKINFKNESAPKKELPDRDDYRYREYNPHEHPLSGLQSEGGWDVVDPEQYYNLPDFEEYKKNYEVVAEEDNNLEINELLTKYDFEELDLKMKSEAAFNFLRGQGKAPYRDLNQNRELAAWHEDYLRANNKYALPFNDTELARITDEEQAELASLYEERANLQHGLGKLLGANTGAKDVNSEVIYSTNKNTVDKKSPSYPITQDTKQLASQLTKLNAAVVALENKLLTDPIKQKKQEEMLMQQRLERSMPEYSQAEIQLQDECLDYLAIRHDRKERKARPNFADGKPMVGEQILEVAQEGAKEKIKTGEMMQGVFFEENYRGQRQLACVQKNGYKRIKYVLVSPILPAGQYAFKMDLDSMFIARNNPNSAIAQVNLMVSLSDPKAVMQEIMENKNKHISGKNINRAASA